MLSAPQPITLRLRKVARYVRLYGWRRTWVKVQARRHLQRAFPALPRTCRNIPPQKPVAIIGCGNFAYSTLAFYLRRTFGPVIGATMDLLPNRAASLARDYNAPLHTTDAEEILAHPAIQFVVIASNHASHAPYAVRALEQGKHVYIEKPHVVSVDQLHALVQAMQRSPGKVFLGFNRPDSRLGRLLAEHWSAQAGPGACQWFVLGHDLPADHWYHRPGEGGRVLGNLCHWTDHLLQLVGPAAFPIQIVPLSQPKAGHLAVGFRFGEGTTATITFTEPTQGGHAFDGVRERFQGQRGGALFSLHDFQRLEVVHGARERRYRNLYRDHGHHAHVTGAFRNACRNLPYNRAAQMQYVANTAWLFLKTREALETGQTLDVPSFEIGPHLPAVQAA